MTENNQRVLNGRYQIQALIGRGGMADVYRGRDLSLEREIAVKMLRPDLARDPMFQTRFKREAQSSASLNHPNIVGVYDTGSAEVSENGGDLRTPFIVMEYVDGVTLRHILHGTPHGDDEHPPAPPEDAEATAETQHSDSDVLGVADPDATQVVPHVTEPLQEKIDSALNRPLTEQEAAGYMSGVLAALSYSHSRGIVHRDIKPSNVMISNTSDVKVMDFGIARALADSAQTMTQTSAVVGTAQYLSPEQARGEVVDHRSDLYSAGCVLFELLTNRPPFIGESPVSVAYQHVREHPPLVSDYNNRVSPAMESVVAKALTKDPALRFQSADEFDDALSDALRGIPIDEGATTRLAAVGAAGFDDVVAGSPAMSARTPEDPDYDDYQEYGQQPRRGSRAGLYVLLVIIAVALVAGATFLLAQALGGGGDDDEVTEEQLIPVPDVAGMPQAEAHAELTNAGLSTEVVTELNNEVEADHAIRTDPEAESEVGPDSEVLLYISEGPGEIEVPDGLIGESEETVRGILEDAGLEVGDITEENHPEYAAGEVISSTPESGSTVDAGSAVNLVISTGEVQLPGAIDNYIGQWRNYAEEFLTAEGFELTPQPRWVETESIDSSGELLGYEVNGESVSGGDTIPNDAPIQIVAGYLPDFDEDEEGNNDEDEDSGNEDGDGGDGGDSGNSDDEDNQDDQDGGNNDEDADNGNSDNGNNDSGNQDSGNNDEDNDDQGSGDSTDDSDNEE